MAIPQRYKYYQHRDGGIYTVSVPRAVNKDDKSEWVVYSHVWPFPPQEPWIQKYEDWTVEGKFREINSEDLNKFMSRDIEEVREEISKARLYRKGK